MSERSDDKANNARKVEKLASERMALFGAAGANAGRTAAVQARLTAIEHELDECFHAVREQRASLFPAITRNRNCPGGRFA